MRGLRKYGQQGQQRHPMMDLLQSLPSRHHGQEQPVHRPQRHPIMDLLQSLPSRHQGQEPQVHRQQRHPIDLLQSKQRTCGNSKRHQMSLNQYLKAVKPNNSPLSKKSKSLKKKRKKVRRK